MTHELGDRELAMSLIKKMQGEEDLSASEQLAVRLAHQDYDLLAALIQRRIELNMTVQDVADKLGTSQEAIEEFESMESDPTLSAIRRYALVVQVSIEHATTPANFS